MKFFVNWLPYLHDFIKWLSKVKPDAFVSFFGTLLGAWIGTTISGKQALRLARNNDIARKKDQYAEFIRLMNELLLEINKQDYFDSKIVSLKLAKYKTKIDKIAELYEMIIKVDNPPCVTINDLNNIKLFISVINTLIEKRDIEAIDSSLVDLKIALYSVYNKFNNYLYDY